MYCHEVNENIYAYCDGSLSPALNSKISQHLDGCESCRTYYGLTKAETEALKETADIPALVADFNAMVMKSLEAALAVSDQADAQPSKKKSAAPVPSRPWYFALVAAAAVLALSLYLPQLFNAGSPVKIAETDNLGSKTELPLTVAVTPNPANTGQVVIDPPTARPRATTPSVNSTVSKPVATLPAGDKQPGTTAQPNVVPESLDTAPAALQIAAPVAEESSRTLADSPSFIPKNLPDRFRLVATDVLNGNETVFNYSSRDEQERLQISVVSYRANTGENLPLTRNVKVGDQTITVRFSGNLPVEELKLLANTVQFEAAGLD